MTHPMPTFEQGQIFLQYLTGFRELGISGEGDTASAPYAAEARAFLEGMMGQVPSPYADNRNKAAEDALKLLCDRLHMLVEAFEFGRWPEYKAAREAQAQAHDQLISAARRIGFERYKLTPDGVVPELPKNLSVAIYEIESIVGHANSEQEI